MANFNRVDFGDSWSRRRSTSEGNLGECKNFPSVEATPEQNQTTLMLQLMRNMEENRALSEARMIDLINRNQSENPMYRIMPDFTKTVCEFNGEGDASVAREWLKRLKSAAILHQWPEAFIVETARTNLVGAAASWYKTVQEEVTTWEEFEKRFKRTFVGTISLTKRWNEMQSRKQKVDETVPSYYYDKLHLCRQLNLSFAEAKEQIITGLKSQEVVSALLAKRHDDSDELLQDIIEFGRVLKTTTEPQSKPKNTSQGKEVVTTNAKTRVPDKRAPAWDNQGQPRCFNCNTYGHLSKDCTNPRKQREALKCFKCQKAGHMKKDCPDQQTLPKTTSTSTVSRVTTSVGDGSSLDKYVRNVCIAGKHTVLGMIDAGSAVCTIRKSVVQRTELPVQLQQRTLYGFGKDNQVECEAVLRTSIAIEDVQADDVEFVVVPDDAQAVDVLVGRTYTELQHLAYVRVGDQLHFGYADVEPFCGMQLENERQRHSPITAAENTMLRKERINFVNVNVNEQCVVMPVHNRSSRDIELRKHEQIGKIETASTPQLKLNRCSEPITRDMVNVDATVTDKDTDKLVEVLNEFRGCFALNTQELGRTNVITMDIVDSGVPVRSKPYRATTREREQIRDIVREWKRYGIVTETTSPYASPVLLVAKKTGDPRLVIDYRQLNNQTVKLNYPIPNVDEQFEHLSGCTVFTTLDLAQGYLQVPLTEEAKAKTAFITPDETGQFERMVFGLTNAPFEFCRLMNLVLGPLKHKTVTCYLDDILIPAKDWGDMLNRLKAVLGALQDAGLTLKIQKCEFGKREVEFLGFIVSKRGVQPGPRKVAAIQEFPRPRNAHEVRRFLGLTGFFRRFVDHYAKLARPLSDLTRKETEFIWGSKQEEAYQELKKKLSEEPIL